MGDTLRTTNADLALILGKIDTRLTVIELTTAKLDKALNGNGKPGILEEFRCLEDSVKKHHDEADAKARVANEKKDKWSTRTWAVVMVMITQIIGLVVLFIRTGGIR